jgi:hypothetical protein
MITLTEGFCFEDKQRRQNIKGKEKELCYKLRITDAVLFLA